MRGYIYGDGLIVRNKVEAIREGIEYIKRTGGTEAVIMRLDDTTAVWFTVTTVDLEVRNQVIVSLEA